LTVTAVGDPEPIDVPDLPVETGSATSSSDGSPIEKLGAVLEAMRMDRGRARAQTPIQGNGEVDWSSLLFPNEKILFTSQVETRCVRRRASRLIPLAVSPLKLKNRQLILTSHRLVCVKQRDRRDLSVKSELAFMDPISISVVTNGKEKDSRTFVVGVETRAEKEFVILTSSKSQAFTTTDTLLASSWVEKITSALESHKQPART